MTGIYIRIKRNGKWQNIEVEYLTDAERDKVLKGKGLMQWIHTLCKIIKNNS